MTNVRGGTGALALVAAALLAAGCTTVSRPAFITAQGTPLQGTTPTGVSAGQGSGGPTTTAAGGSGALGSTGPALSSGGVIATAGGDATTGAVGSIPAAGHCTQPVKIGISYSSDESAGLAAVGNPGEASSVGAMIKAQQALDQRAADDLNNHGGLGGCKVVLGYHDFKALGSDGFSGESQSECVDFAEDQHVFAVINTTLENKTLVTCLAQHHVVDLYYGSTYQVTPQDYAAYKGYVYEPGGIDIMRWGPFIDELGGVGYFPPGTKVGILVADDGSGNDQALVNDVWKPKLEARGITPVVFTFSQIEGFSDVSQTTTQFGAAVLAFKQAGVNHVIATPDNGDVEIFFTQVAESQNFRPRYAFTSANGPTAWGTEPAGQRPNALDVSYSWLDISPSAGSPELTAIPATPARSRCDALYKGRTGSSSITTTYGICDAFNFLGAALAGASQVTPASLLGGVDALGSSLSLADGFGNARYGEPDHYDGGVVTRVLEWNDTAQTWQFAGGPYSNP